jgi:2-polyprenyl-3-methyl-5-hydroxy-6-metoxy-1,4-benzoquinol methylase
MPIIRNHREEDGILVFDSDLDQRSTYDEAHLEVVEKAERSHFWFAARRDIICQLFRQNVDKKCSILELGGGTGFVAESLIKRGFSVQMADIHRSGLDFAKKRGIKDLYQFDLFYPPFENEFDVICLFDVLEHLQEDAQALKCIKKMLKPDGRIILSVPAHQWLWSRDDAIAGHKRRYTKKLLREVFVTSNLKPLQIRYFFMSILPLLLLRSWLKKDEKIPLKTDESIEVALHPFINQILYSLTKLESRLERYLPNIIGGSLLSIAQTIPDDPNSIFGQSVL